jgi:hypothetical protein
LPAEDSTVHVNNQVVHALMHLRCVDLATLAGLAHVTAGALQSWIYQGDDEAVGFDQQLEVLSFLGVRSESPRSDVVHYWSVHENFFSRASSSYWALQVVLKAFGDAEAAFIARDTDPALSFSAQAHFGLRFNGFMAILSVTAHPLRSVSFDPEWMEGLTWASDTLGVLIPADEYARLEPGAMQVKGMAQYLTYSAEMTQWERLREQAHAQGIRAEQVADLLLGGAASVNARISVAQPAPVVKAAAEVAPAEPPVKPVLDAGAAAAPPEPAATPGDLFTTPVRPAHFKRA